MSAFIMEQQSCQLPRFSPELIFMIVGYNDPPEILSLSLTCSGLHHRCRSLLEQHQDAYSKYRITSDLSPETVVDLLKDTPQAEINRFHVREIEFWGTRLGWKDWRSWDPALSANYQLAEEEPSRSALDAREVQRYIQRGLRWWDLTEEEIEDAQLNLELGNDGYLKLFLISSCPRLHSIIFVKRRGDAYNSLAWIAEATQWSLRDKWPPGFESLRSIAVGMSIGRLPNEEDDDEENYHRLDQFAKLFVIPHLKNIYFSELCGQEDFWEEYEDFFPHGTSSNESISVDGLNGDWEEFYQGLSGASRKLNTVVIRATDSPTGGMNRLDSLVDNLDEKNEVERLVLYHPTAMQNQMCGRGDIYTLKSVKQITRAAADIDFRFDYTATNSTVRWPVISLAFPPNIEAAYIWGELYGPMEQEIRALKYFDLFLAELIESGFYKHLKVIYVEHAERTYRQFVKDTSYIAEWKQLAFPETTAAGHKAGVHVCTLMNRDDGGYWKNFPARPDRFDIKTGPFAAKRPEEWKLNLYTGQWEPTCSGCGECEECLALYPSELWKENAAQRSNSS